MKLRDIPKSMLADPRFKMQGELPKEKKKLARGDGYKSQLERDYAVRLDMLKSAGEIRWWAYEGVTLKLAHDTRYTPDFFVQLPSGDFEFHETKGFMRPAARVKIEVARRLFPFPILLVRREGREWRTE